MNWLNAHQQLSYIVLFLGAYFETLIGPGFFISGEFFLISGSVLAGMGVLHVGFVAIALYGGGILGDSSSYFIGRWNGKIIFKEGRWIFNLNNYKKGEDFFKRHGTKAIFFARLLGPLSWITPFFAGTYKVPYKKFLAYNIPGVLIGIGEFLVIGYFFGNQYAAIFSFIRRYLEFAVGAIILFFIGRWYIKRIIKRKNNKL